MPSVPFTGRRATGNATASPWASGTTSDARLLARTLLGQHELAAREFTARRRKQNRHLERKHLVAVEILVQAVVVARAIAQEQRRGPRLPGGMTAGEIVGK